MSAPSEGMEQDLGVSPGPYTAWSTPNGMRSEIRKGGQRVGRVFVGEMSWADAARRAGDRNSEHQREASTKQRRGTA